MSRFDRGWFSMDREILVKLGKDANLWAVWTYLNYAANVYRSEIKCGRSLIVIEPRQMLITVQEISIELDLDRKTVRRCLSFLVACGAIVSTRTYRSTIISLQKNEKNESRAPHYEPIQYKGDSDSKNLVLPTDLPTDLPITLPMTGTHIKELRTKELTREGEGNARAREEIPPPLNLKSIGNGERIGEGNPIEDRNSPHSDAPIIKTIERQGMDQETPLKTILGSKKVWEIFIAERLEICGIEKTSPTVWDINHAQTLVNELKTEEVVLERIRQYLNWKKQIYVDRAWPIRMLVEDRLEIATRKELLQKKRAEEGKKRVDSQQKAANEEATRKAKEMRNLRQQQGMSLKELSLIGISTKGLK